jgi:beta-xylosidase
MQKAGICSLPLLLTLFLASAAPAQTGPTSKPAALVGRWGDQGDGTYVNPILPADFSDIDAIRVGDDFYAISSTLHLSPGMVILHSKDLVNWQIIGHAANDLSAISAEMSWDRMNRYGRGVWAGAIRYHENQYWIYFGMPDEGLFVTTAADPAGPWSPPQSVWKTSGWDDCCPFWDDDGSGYLLATNFAKDPKNDKTYNIHLFKLSNDGRSLMMDSDRIIHQSRGSEANKLYKINGTYYHYFSEVRSEGRVPMIGRAKSLDGPWETKQIGHVNKNIDKEPNQGALIELKSRQWWFLTHQGAGDWEGRAMALLPVTWIDGWPIVGQAGDDGIGSMVWSARKPIEGMPIVLPQTSDEFDGGKLSPQWEWNHQPRAEKWSLAPREGFLRLEAFASLDGDNLRKVANIISQRAFRAADSVATLKLDLSGMGDGQKAGLCHFARTWSTLAVVQSAGARKLILTENGSASELPPIPGDSIWLRSSWGLEGISQYSYSSDGTTFTPVGTVYPLTWGNYRGDRIGIFTYNNAADRGYVDVDWFHYTFEHPTR